MQLNYCHGNHYDIRTSLQVLPNNMQACKDLLVCLLSFDKPYNNEKTLSSLLKIRNTNLFFKKFSTRHKIELSTNEGIHAKRAYIVCFAGSC